MLPAETARVWDFLKQQAGMNGFIVIGGSALSLRINHRISENPDVASRGNCLPSARLNALVRSFEEHGFRLVPVDDPAAAFEFESAGQELRTTNRISSLTQRLSFHSLNPMSFEAAAQMEKDLAEHLRAEGYTVARST